MQFAPEQTTWSWAAPFLPRPIQPKPPGNLLKKSMTRSVDEKPRRPRRQINGTNNRGRRSLRMSLRHATNCHYHSAVQPKLKFPLIFATLAALFICLTHPGRAQQAIEAQAPFNVNAYRLGERLTYNVNYGHFVSAAHVEMLIAGHENFFGRDGIQLRAHVETNGVVNVALLSINNDYTTYIFPDSGLPYRSQQVVRQAGRTTEASVDYNQPAGTDALPSQLRTAEAGGTLDLLSALYRVRAMPLTPGSSYFTT